MLDKHKFKARALMVIILATGIAGIYLVVLGALEPVVGSRGAGLASLFIIGIMLFATPLTTAVQRWAHAVARGFSHDRAHALAESIGELMTIRSFEELPDFIMTALKDGLGAESACLFLNGDEGEFLLQWSFGLPGPDPSALRMCSEIVGLLQETRRPLERAHGKSSVSQRDPGVFARCLEDIASEIAVPLWQRGELLGVLGLGRRKGGGPYRKGEIDLIEEFAAAAAAAIENTRQHRNALTDRLTGLPSRNYFLMRVGEEIREAKRHKYAVSLLVADIDDFRSLNQQYGRMTGDLVLKEVVAELRSACRDSDTMARYGGEKFAVLLAEASAEDAGRVGERLRKKIENLKPEGLSVTVSIGIGHFTARECESYDKDKLLARVDQAVARAKERGKNRVEVVV